MMTIDGHNLWSYLFLACRLPSLICCMSVSSISYKATDCDNKNATFGAVEMLVEDEVDVIFGPSCAVGELNQTIVL